LSVRRGKLQGVYKTLLHHPDLTERVSGLGDLLRFEGVLSLRQKEVVILATARGVSSRFVWQQHESIARKVGTPEETIEAIRSETPPNDPLDLVFVEVANSVVAGTALSEAIHNRVCTYVGVAGCVEAVTIAGFYKMINALVISFEVPLPRPEEPSF
ncbi:MAG: carboxymuconolactone decarboxylase family protein, partial [Hyphomicrobiales bacterium]